MNDIFAIAASFGLGTGLIGIVLGLSPGRRTASTLSADELISGRRHGDGTDRSPRMPPRWHILLPCAIGLLLGLVTRWPVVAVLGAVAARTVMTPLARTHRPQVVPRMEAVAVWTEMLRDTLAAAAGLSQAMIVIGPSAPIVIRTEAVTLANRIASGTSIEVALRSFSVELDDPSSDLVVCALLLAVKARTQRIVDLLSALASATREDVATRLADRCEPSSRS